jgi:glutamine cyclotransferase
MKSNRFLLAAIASIAAWFSISCAHGQTIHGYKVIGSMEQPRENFVQGLQIVDDSLYVSTGKYGKSQLLRYKMLDGTLQDAKQLDARLFGEGLTVLNDKIYQLTWRSKIALVYNKEDMKGYKWFRIAGEGWGLTNNGKDLIYSDGSHRLYFLSADTLALLHSIEVTEGGKKIEKLNELEWIDGKIWANIWGSDRIVIIDPQSGHVIASIDLSGLLPDNERRTDTNVLNGIAQNPADGTIWVTGKYWPKLFQIEVVPPLATATPKEQSYEQ